MQLCRWPPLVFSTVSSTPTNITLFEELVLTVIIKLGQSRAKIIEV